jgi:hypothetical protein
LETIKAEAYDGIDPWVNVLKTLTIVTLVTDGYQTAIATDGGSLLLEDDI